MNLFTRYWIAFVIVAITLGGLTGVVNAQDTSDVIIGLPGKLRAATGEDFSYYFDANDGTTYGIVGESPDVQEKLDQYGKSDPTPSIKVWGKTQPSNSSPGTSVIVASNVLGPDYTLPSQRPTPVVPVIQSTGSKPASIQRPARLSPPFSTEGTRAEAGAPSARSGSPGMRGVAIGSLPSRV